MGIVDRVRGVLADIEAERRKRTETFSQDEAVALRAKEQGDHKTWLRENAESVVVPEHPAVALLREIEWVNTAGEAVCPECCGLASRMRDKVNHEPDCRLAAILTGSKPGERALSDLLAEERERGLADLVALLTKETPMGPPFSTCRSCRLAYPARAAGHECPDRRMPPHACAPVGETAVVRMLAEERAKGVAQGASSFPDMIAASEAKGAAEARATDAPIWNDLIERERAEEREACESALQALLDGLDPWSHDAGAFTRPAYERAMGAIRARGQR